MPIRFVSSDPDALRARQKALALQSAFLKIHDEPDSLQVLKTNPTAFISDMKVSSGAGIEAIHSVSTILNSVRDGVDPKTVLADYAEYCELDAGKWEIQAKLREQILPAGVGRLLRNLEDVIPDNPTRPINQPTLEPQFYIPAIPVRGITYLPDGRIANCTGRAIHFYDKGQLDPKPILMGDLPAKSLDCCLFYSKPLLVTNSSDNCLRFYDLQSRAVFKQSEKITEGSILSVAVSRDGKHVYCVLSGKVIAHYDLVKGELTKPIAVNQFPSSVACSHDGKKVVVGDKQGLSLYDSVSGKETKRVSFDKPFDYVACSPDSLKIVGASKEGEIWLFDSGLREIAATDYKPSPKLELSNLALSEHGNEVVTGWETHEVGAAGAIQTFQLTFFTADPR